MSLSSSTSGIAADVSGQSPLIVLAHSKTITPQPSRSPTSFSSLMTLKGSDLLIVLILVILGLLAENRQLHRQFQANTVKSKRVLSFHYLGLHIYQYEWIQFHNIAQQCIQKTIKILLEKYIGSFDEKAFL